MWRFVAYVVAGFLGVSLFGAAALTFVRVYLDSTACESCGGDSLKSLPEASLLPDGSKVLNAYSVDSSDISKLDPAYVREAEGSHTAAAITGYYDQQLLGSGWSRLKAGDATARAGVVGLGTDHVTWAKGDLRFEVSFEMQLSLVGAKPTSGPQRFTVTLSRLR